MKPWQHGIPLDLLKSLSGVYKAHDGERPLGAFTAVKENMVAQWMDDGDLHVAEDAIVALHRSMSQTTVKDFRRLPICTMPPGTIVVDRAAGSAQGMARIIENLAGDAPILWRCWADHIDDTTAARMLNMTRVGTIIRASSEILAVWVRGATTISNVLPQADTKGITPLRTDIPGFQISQSDLADLEGWPHMVSRIWVDHYSSYNKRKSWYAVALRSFGGNLSFIEKPSEMSKAWKASHPEEMMWEVKDTPLYNALPGAREILDRIPAKLERVRLMRLSGGGELSRHSDITDHDAGTADGQIMRLHLPIVTNPGVRFTSWDLYNQPNEIHMSPGRWWYLDVRKPHRAINTQGAERIHLVVDAVANQTLREAIL